MYVGHLGHSDRRKRGVALDSCLRWLRVEQRGPTFGTARARPEFGVVSGGAAEHLD